jgi:hypothetical protein
LFGKLSDGGTARIDIKQGAIDIECEPAPARPPEPDDVVEAAKPAPPAKTRAPVN